MPAAVVPRRPSWRSVVCAVVICVGSLLLAGAPADAQSGGQGGVRRCTGADGRTVYTDRACADLGATERRPPTTGSGVGNSGRLHRGGCARSVQELALEVTFAIDSQDVNRLAASYHWVGVSARGSVAIMNQLQAIARRPLVDVAPIYPAPPEPDPEQPGSDFEQALDALYREASRPRRPVGLRVEQTLGNTATPSRTVFGLRRHLDCWWITL